MATTTSSSPGWLDWAYSGVDHSLPGNGGVQCRDFLSLSQRSWESVVACGVAVGALMVAVPRLKLPPLSCVERPDPLGKRLLLLSMCLTFGIELGFKFATRQMIWIGNPCHLATMVQIFILAAPPSRVVTAAFRLQLHMLTGAPIAILFPVINTRLLPFETGVYFVQHILMLVIPLYLMSTGDPFIPEALTDFSWAMTSFGFLFIYHFLPLQLLAYLSHVNLNNMLCPAVSDPFHGQYYRLFAIGHQLILIPLQGKLLVYLAQLCGIMPRCNPQDEPIGRNTCASNIASHSNSSLECNKGDSYLSHDNNILHHTNNTTNTSMTSNNGANNGDGYDDSGYLGTACALTQEQQQQQQSLFDDGDHDDGDDGRGVGFHPYDVDDEEDEEEAEEEVEEEMDCGDVRKYSSNVYNANSHHHNHDMAAASTADFGAADMKTVHLVNGQLVGSTSVDDHVGGDHHQHNHHHHEGHHRHQVYKGQGGGERSEVSPGVRRREYVGGSYTGGEGQGQGQGDHTAAGSSRRLSGSRPAGVRCQPLSMTSDLQASRNNGHAKLH